MGFIDIFISRVAPVSIAIIFAGILFIDNQTIPGYVVLVVGFVLQILYLFR